MSNVQLSGTLERLVARRTFPLHARTGVCRNLFGPVDHDELSVELRGKLGEIIERDQRRWNFNFKEDTPLPGHYAWEDVSTIGPAFYRDCLKIGRKQSGLSENEIVNPESTTVDYKDAKVSVCNELLSSNVRVFSANSSGINQENRYENVNSGSKGCPSTPSVCRKNTQSSDSSKLSSTQVTDFFHKRKRTYAGKETECTSPNLGVPVSAEQTLRKRIR
ncbi:hypothetical protein AALO_G00195100 [Alosa alosa]|uniref:Cyclin-dependent kinase inhibitor domain-containing protein n=1 Tax=Alosa alosa TaxID=278164 RepID=A0AAV6G6J4_9TELE|nr:cyclin-dependent kinase inhibitor 1B-like [Alosa sapidissima]XP_048118816.1 cyclin-dependent kinase inhibitor 1B-like [Alosa alosa]KAG5270658.1 hypothetical protein AALO_G00195100 [Alosa alosa]